MARKDEYDKIAEKLDIEEVRMLTARKLRDFKFRICDEIADIAEFTKEGLKGDNVLVSLALANYNSARTQMQKYGLWEQRYDTAFSEARKTGKCNIRKIFYGDKKR